jgi:predicted PurR-regulated permease PerM
LVVTLVAGAVIVGALALWKLRLVIAVLFFAITMAAAMRPTIEWGAQRRVPRAVGLLLHYLLLLGLIALFLWFVVPHLITQLESAVRSAKHPGVHHGSGIKDQILNAVNKYLRRLPTGSQLIHPAVSYGKTALEVLLGIFFAFATAAYWLFERDKTIDLVTSLLPRPRRKKVRDTWDLIDAKLGAFVRGQVLLMGFVGVLVAVAYWLIGEPYWLLLGIASGILEVVPVIGPLVAVILAIGAGLTISWHTALFAAIAFFAIRLVEDYLVSPRLLGGTVGLSPLLVLVSVTAAGILLGGFYVLLAVPIAAVIGTIVDVVVFDVEPAEEPTPTVLFSAKDAE